MESNIIKKNLFFKIKDKFTKDKNRQMFWGYLFILPVVVFLIIFMFIPIVQIFYYSLTNWDGGFNSEFIGLKNFADMIHNPDFWTVLKNNLIILVLGVPLWTIFPIIIAVLLYEEIKGYKFFKTVYFFPSVLSIVIVGTLFKIFFGYTGPINQLFKTLGLDNLVIEWLGSGKTSLPIIVASVNWAGFGSAILIYLAAMSAIDTSVYEASELDGVSWFKKVWYITLPLIKNVVQFTIVLNIIHAFSQMYAYVMVMTNGGPGYESTVLEYFIYLKGFRAGDMGYASALSVVLFVLVLLISLTMNTFSNRKEE
jgi:multiple sugar transport system permease protein